MNYIFLHGFGVFIKKKDLKGLKELNPMIIEYYKLNSDMSLDDVCKKINTKLPKENIILIGHSIGYLLCKYLATLNLNIKAIVNIDMSELLEEVKPITMEEAKQLSSKKVII